MNEGHVRKFGREKPLDIDPTRVACGTILRISNVPHQLEMLNISHQGEIRVESKGLQGWGRLVQILQPQASARARKPVKGCTCS